MGPNGPAAYSPQNLDQLLAPIALYPDPLLSQVLMAATYPLEVVEAARWLQGPGNAALHGDPLDAALQQQAWDPSVKSLVPFPQTLRMMNDRLDWTQALGNAFLAQQGDVMDAVQRLRAQARAAGTLQSTPQETVSVQDQAILVEPATPDLVYVPYYDPRTVYGTWRYPDAPPYYFPPPPSYSVVSGPALSFGIGVGVIGALWGWNRWDWGRHDIHIDPDRYNRINSYAIQHDNRPRYTASNWQHDPSHRRGVPYGTPAARQQFSRPVTGSVDARREFRGLDNRPGLPAAAAPVPPGRGPGGPRGGEDRRPGQVAPPTPQGVGHALTPAPAQPHPPAVTGAAIPGRPPVQRPMAPAFSSYGRGPDIRAQAERGQFSRHSTPAPAQPRPAAPQLAAPHPAASHAAPPPGAPPAPHGGPPHNAPGPARGAPNDHAHR